MYTQCTHCLTVFEIDDEALLASLGIVRCGHCAERFDALRTLTDSLPAEPGAVLPERDPDAFAPILTSAVSPEAMQAAAGPVPSQASETTPAQDPLSPPDYASGTTQPDPTWLDTLSGDRARALIADAAGIPPEAIQNDDPAWQLVEAPTQARIAEFDAVPATGTGDVSDPAEPDARPTVPTSLNTAKSAPFTEAWRLDMPGPYPADPPAGNGDSVDDGAWFPSLADATEETADNTGNAVSLADDGVAQDLDPWWPDDQPRAHDTSPPDTLDTDAVPAATTELQDDLFHHEVQPTGIVEPVYVPPRRRRIHRNDWLWGIGCAVLALVLAGQVAWASRVALVRDPATQAQALRVCAHLDCRLPPIRDIARLELLSRDVRPDPDDAGALAITATFRNNAPFRQPWPIVVVELTDLDNNVVAMRRFRPAEYVPDAHHGAGGIDARSTAAVAFEVADPGKRAVSFHFGFD